MRCFEEIEKKKRGLKLKEQGKNQPTTISDGDTPEYRPRKNVNISIANILHGAKTIETEDDIEELLQYIMLPFTLIWIKNPCAVKLF